MRRTTFGRVCVFVIFSVLCWLYLHERVSEVNESNETELLKRSPALSPALGNFEPKSIPTLRVGPGEGGKPHKTNKHPEAVEYGINLASSEEISLERSIPDTRLPECKYLDYPQNLPKASIIIVFEDVGWSLVMRTVYSIMKRTPAKLIEEVLLIDDDSKVVNFKDFFKNYIKKFRGKVKYIRNGNKTGLIQARNHAVKKALGEIIVFLDPYCEVNVNWLPPLISPIYSNTTSITVPIIDNINPTTFEYTSVRQASEHYRGIFDWGLVYKEHKLPPNEMKKRKHESDPYQSPVHAGGLLAVSRDFFLSVGGYDGYLVNWGNENFDLSFKSWQCARGIMWVPCARVGHIYKGFTTHISHYAPVRAGIRGPPSLINLKRVVETWLDPEYKKHFYIRVPLAHSVSHGDISRQLSQKRKLKCKSFDWYIKNVAYDILDTYPELPENAYWGQIINMKMERCIAEERYGSSGSLIGQICEIYDTQYLIRLNTKGQLAIDDNCIDIVQTEIKIVSCTPGSVAGPWHFNETTRSLFHSVLRKCAAIDPSTLLVVPTVCNSTDAIQKWKFKTIVPSWNYK